MLTDQLGFHLSDKSADALADRVRGICRGLGGGGGGRLGVLRALTAETDFRFEGFACGLSCLTLRERSDSITDV